MIIFGNYSGGNITNNNNGVKRVIGQSNSN